MAEFSGKVALVTGGGTGIGRAAALAFAGKGAKVVVAGRRRQEGEETVRLIEQQGQGGEARFVQTDVTQELEVKRLVETTVASFGRLDFAFNNAGNEGQPGPLTELSEEGWDQTIDTNLKGTWLSMKYELRQMLKQGGGAIVNMASGAGHIGMANMVAYSAAKQGIVGLTRSAAVEYAKAGIRINSVSPGAILTSMPERVFGNLDNFRQTVGQFTPLGRVGEPEEVGQTAVWLCSEGASFLTGVDVPVDGGLIVS